MLLSINRTCTLHKRVRWRPDPVHTTQFSPEPPTMTQISNKYHQIRIRTSGLMFSACCAGNICPDRVRNGVAPPFPAVTIFLSCSRYLIVRVPPKSTDSVSQSFHFHRFLVWKESRPGGTSSLGSVALYPHRTAGSRAEIQTLAAVVVFLFIDSQAVSILA